ncbi:MAG: peptide deformylase, partial [Bradyrhizobium sp.]|uniref:peptide deformylase n=1 Tax=Bradyrhizobium sp. TaxID=376 RepID=UPI0025BABB1D
MAIREIIILPDKQLRLISKPVETITSEVRKLADDMFETMYAAPGIGLAAIQVAQPVRLITMDLAKKGEDGETKP